LQKKVPPAFTYVSAGRQKLLFFKNFIEPALSERSESKGLVRHPKLQALLITVLSVFLRGLRPRQDLIKIQKLIYKNFKINLKV